MILDAYDEAHPCGIWRRNAWHRLGLQDRQTAVFVLPGGGPVVNPTAWDTQSPCL